MSADDAVPARRHRSPSGHSRGEVITSPANPTLAFVRALSRRDRRAAERAFVVEGVRAVRDALETGAVPRLILLREGNEHLLSDLPVPAGVAPRVVTTRLFDRLSDVQTPQGVLAVFPFPDLEPDPGDAAPLILVLDRLRDPGNLGTLLRAAAAAGVSAVYLSPQTVDPWNPKAVRAGMGAHFRLPLLPLDAEAMAALRQRAPRRIVANASATRAYDEIDWTGSRRAGHRRGGGRGRARAGRLGHRGGSDPTGGGRRVPQRGGRGGGDPVRGGPAAARSGRRGNDVTFRTSMSGAVAGSANFPRMFAGFSGSAA